METTDKFIHKYEDGEAIFREGDHGHEMFVVLSGEVEICKQSEQCENHAIARLGAGEMFGEMALVGDGRRSATALARGQETLVVRIDQARFVYLVSQQPAFALSVMRMMAHRLAGQAQGAPLLQTA